MLGRNEEALARGEEAVRIHRELAQLQPDAFLPALSGSLHNLVSFCRETGKNVNCRPKCCISRVSLFQLYR